MLEVHHPVLHYHHATPGPTQVAKGDVSRFEHARARVAHHVAIPLIRHHGRVPVLADEGQRLVNDQGLLQTVHAGRQVDGPAGRQRGHRVGQGGVTGVAGI